MDLKPSRNPSWPGIARNPKRDPLKEVDPWQGVKEAFGAKPQARRRWAAETKGATPPRDGPWSLAAAGVSMQNPVRALKRARKPRKARVT